MNYLKKHFSLYAHLPREIYVLAFGKIMTSMGALIWPMMTLIMSEKLGMNGQTIGLYTMLLSLFMGPFYLLGGKLADKYNKKTIIVTFDLIGNSLYLVCAMLPLSMNTLYLLAIASVFQSMEQPAYDALIADLTPYTDRERAYSLNYLAYNLGLVMAPTIGGLLFNNHLNLSFLINGLADLSSTLLILFFIHNLKAVRQDGRPENVYEQGQSSSIFQVLRQRKLFFLLFLIMGLSSLIYSQFNFLMPLHMEQAFRGSGALKFGMLTSVNAITVVVGTPILTKLLSRMIDLRVMYLGQFLESAGLACFIVLGRHFWIAIVGMVVFTTGEICLSISQTPYITKRIPETHRGRFLSISSSCVGLIGVCSNYGVGILIDHYPIPAVWSIIAAIGVAVLVLYAVYLLLDRKTYSKLYEKQ